MPSPCAASSTSVMGQEKNTGLTIFFFGYCHVFLFVRSQHFFQMFDLDFVRISENNKIIRRKTKKKNLPCISFSDHRLQCTRERKER